MPPARPLRFPAAVSWFATTPALALVVSLAVALKLGFAAAGGLDHYLGDTDDAMRLVIVRELLAGRAWYDIHVGRLQPPAGSEMHWSRLIDGGQAAFLWLARLFVEPTRAEWLMRLIWPLLWLLPAIWPTLVIARRLGGQSALWVCALLVGISLPLYGQWRPGRVDHHDIQIALCILALAGAAVQGRRGAILAGAACALGLAVGLESLPFLAIIGAAMGLRLLFDPQGSARPVRDYGLAMAATITAVFLAQTPPARWGLAACDALGANFWAGALVAGLGLATAAHLAGGRAFAVRLGALAVAGGAAAGVFVAMDPACLAGPTAHLDPRVRPIWFDFVIEMRPLLAGFQPSAPDSVVAPIAMTSLGIAAWLWLGLRREARTAAWMLLGAVVILGAIMGWRITRLAYYPAWFAVPLVAAALADIGSRLPTLRLFVPLFLACALSPLAVSHAIQATGVWDKAKAADPAPRDYCLLISSYRRLATLPPGLVLSEIDIGPYVLANTPHSVMSAPYHRATDGILAANAVLAAPPGRDAAEARRHGVTYIANCAARADRLTHAVLPPDSLQARLDRGRPPPWLEPLSPPSEPLQLYRVRR